MKLPRLKQLLCATSLILSTSLVFGESTGADTQTKPAKPEKEKSYFLASLLPTAFQTHPLLAISVITEMTDLGKKLPLPTSERPYHYFMKSMGYHHEGHEVSEEGKVSEDNIQKLVQSALARSHYLPTDNDHPATFVLFYFWGVHSKLDEADKETGEGGFKDVGYKNLLSRALLVGGEKFTKKFASALQDRDQWVLAGQVGPDPLYMFSERSDLNRNLVEQVMDNCYYIVVSAYDAAALAKGERKLLWRTKMSTPAQGVSLAETTPALVASGGSYFGQDMSEPTIVDKRINRKGTVGMGDLKVMEMDGKPSEKSDQDTPVPAGKK
jgi:hypothetical protein